LRKGLLVWSTTALRFDATIHSMKHGFPRTETRAGEKDAL